MSDPLTDFIDAHVAAKIDAEELGAFAPQIACPDGIPHAWRDSDGNMHAFGLPCPSCGAAV